MKKRIISCVLAFLILFYIPCVNANTTNSAEGGVLSAFRYLSPEPIHVAAAELNQVDKILNFGRSLMGSTEYNGYCQRFVRLCYEAAGIYANKAALTALEAWGMWGVSTRIDNIPIGACVYFQGYGYDWTYGHVAIYIGNGYVLDATYNYGVSERYVTNWTGCLGWGYQAGIAPTGKIEEVTTQTPTTTQESTTQEPTTNNSSKEDEEVTKSSDEIVNMAYNQLVTLLQNLLSLIIKYMRGV